MITKKNEIDFFDDFEVSVVSIVEVKEERSIPPKLSCPECGGSLRIRSIDSKDKSLGKAWYCSQDGRQTYDEYGRR